LEYIINQLFLFYKLDIGDVPFSSEKVDIWQELNNFIANNKEIFHKKGLAITLDTLAVDILDMKNTKDMNAENIVVEVDIVQFRNVIHNILENSVKYKERENAEMNITCRADSEFITIAFTDNGPGVPEDSLDKLFDVFYRSDISRNNPSKGSGLGLAISKKIIEHSNGQIKAENAPGGGLSVIIKLPVVK
jgi:signal transduction histidine kinase